MPWKYVGATYHAVPVADYEEVPGYTCARLQDAGVYFDALAHYKKARAAVKSGRPKHPELQGQGDVKKDGKFRWIRTHWPPKNLAEVAAAESVPKPVEPIEPVAASTVVLTTESEPAQDGESAATVTVPTVVVPAAATEAERDELAVESGAKQRKPRDANPVDNSYPIRPYEDKPLTVDEMARAARWAMLNAMHVKARRLTIRDAPSELAWGYVDWALDDLKGLATFIHDKLEKTLLKQAEIKAKREDDDRQFFGVYRKLAKAEARSAS